MAVALTSITNRLSTEVIISRVISMEISVFGLFFDQKSQMQGVEFLVAIFSQNIPSHDLRTSSMSD